MGNFVGLASEYNKEAFEGGRISPSQKSNMQKWPQLFVDVLGSLTDAGGVASSLLGLTSKT